MPKETIYFDNNGTTARCRVALDELMKWSAEPINASTGSKYGVMATKMLNDGTKYIQRHCSAPDYSVIFTSGASESNCLILRSVAEAYRYNTKMVPHIITSAVEHNTILECCRVLQMYGAATTTVLPVDIRGCVAPSDVEKAIKSNTALISIIAANNELGSINDLEAIGKIAHKNKIPFHSDFVQLFGKFRLNLPSMHVDSISVSFHKLGGAVGCGLLLINNNLIKGYKLNAQIHGTQQLGLRGGTQNVPAIASSIVAMEQSFEHRDAKNKRLLAKKNYLLTELAKQFPFADYATYLDATAKHKKIELVLLGQTDSAKSLPNTVLLAIAKNSGKSFCNVELKHELEKNNIIVSIGSACNTKSKKASHVLDAIKAPPVIRKGVIRISFCDSNTKDEIDTFVATYVRAVRKQI